MDERPSAPATRWKLADGRADAPAAFLCVESVGSERHAVVSLHGSLDTRASLSITSQLTELLAQPLRSMTLDLAAVTFVDSAGVGVLTITRNRAATRRIDLHLRAVPPPVHRVLDITGMLDLFSLVPGGAGAG